MNDHQAEFDANLANWDERVAIHFDSPMYREHLDDLRAGGHCLSEQHLELVGDVAGKRLIHLQCHMGMETLSWARLGAESVGVDFSTNAIGVGRELADELNLSTEFVCCNVYDTLDHVQGKFDVVFVSIGALCWLPDVPRWAQLVASLLKPGGLLYLSEAHPFADVFDDAEDGTRLEIRYPYFHDGEPLRFDEPGTYADRDAQTAHNTTYDWAHPVSEVINAVIGAGMTIERFDESTDCVWPRFKLMKQVTPNQFELPEPLSRSIPHMYTLMARKR